MRGHFGYDFFGNHFGFGPSGCSDFREPFGHHGGPCGFSHHGPPGPPRGPHDWRPDCGPAFDHHGHGNFWGPGFGHSFEPHGPPHGRHHGARQEHHGPPRDPGNDHSPDRHEHRSHGPHRGPHHSPDRHCQRPQGPEYDHSPDRHDQRPPGPHRRGRPSPDRHCHGPLDLDHFGGPRCGRRFHGRHHGFGCGSPGRWMRHGPHPPCFGRSPSPCGRRRRRDCNDTCCKKNDQSGRDGRKGNGLNTEKDKDQNVTGDTVLVQRIVVERGGRPNSV